MHKILPIYSIGKYLKGLFVKSVKQTEMTVAEKAEKVAEEPAKVTSKQIEAYYKRYEKHLGQKKQEDAPKDLKQRILDSIQDFAEGDAYNKRRFIEVSEDALKTLEINFEEKRKKVVDIILANSENLSPLFKKGVTQIETPSDLALYIRAYASESNKSLLEKYKDIVKKTMDGKNLSLKTQQKILADESKIVDVKLELVKAVVNPSVDSRVVAIENLLKQLYGMDFVHLESMEEAEKILKAIDIVKKYNVPMPQNIIITPFTTVFNFGETLLHSSGERTIMIQSQKERTTNVEEAFKKFVSPTSASWVKQLRADDRTHFSTNDPLHVYVHEFMHLTQPLEVLLPFKCKQVPAKIAQTAGKVSSYACSARAELDAEVKTKNALRSLNNDEKEVLKYFE